MIPRSHVVAETPSGSWRMFVHPVGQVISDVTVVRGAPTGLGSLSTKDPFGPAAATLSFPGVTVLDALGSGDLAWCVPEADVDIVWVGATTAENEEAERAYVWEGYLASFDYEEDGSLVVTCAGAMMQLDNYLAKPEYVYQPLPYEIAIARQFDNHPDSRLAPLRGLDYGPAVVVAGYEMGPLDTKDAAGPAWKGRGIPAPVKVPVGTTPYRVVVVVGHGLVEGDAVRVYGSRVHGRSSNNGVFSVLRVLDDDRFLVNMPTGAVEEDVIDPGLMVRRRPTMFPDWWTTKFDASDTKRYPKGQTWLLPSELANGQAWSGMLTRDTGKFEPSLSNYVQGLLANMHTARGQFTLLLDPGRVPYLTHREHLAAPDASTLVVDLLTPGVRFTKLSRDYTQRIGVVYAQGRATTGDVYTGMQVTADGSGTWYDPAAYRRQVHPLQSNRWLDLSVMRKEVMLSFSDGLDEQEAIRASADHLRRFADPGWTGTLALSSDPSRGGVPFPRQAITAGMNIQVRGLFGREDGVLFHITEAGTDAESVVSLTLDSLFRDHLTVDQVRKRGRDSLVPYRMLSTAGTYDPKIPDLLYPWSYAKGAGVVPFGGAALFTRYGPSKVPRGSVSGMFDVPFPWTEYTTAYPPKKHPGFYAYCGPADHTNADLNWANAYKTANTHKFKPYFCQLAAAGEIKLFQMAAYDGDGNVKRVPFHVSLYYSPGVSYTMMPQIDGKGVKVLTKLATAHLVSGSATMSITGLPKGHGLSVGETFYLVTSTQTSNIDGTFSVVTTAATSVTTTLAEPAETTHTRKVAVYDPYSGALEFPYDAGQHYPFFPSAWEKILPDGRLPTNQNALPATGQAPIVGWGTGYEKAGFWPGSSSDNDAATGLLVDEGGITFDFRGLGTGIDQRKTMAANMKTPSRVRAYVMIYCDADPDEPTYFLGRAFRKEYVPS